MHAEGRKFDSCHLQGHISNTELVLKEDDVTELTIEQLEFVQGGQCYRGRQEYRAKIMNWHKIKEKKIKKFNFYYM